MRGPTGTAASRRTRENHYLSYAALSARAVGADVIAISNSQSPLARKATVCLAVDHAEDSTSFLPMISRILQLLLIDIMAVGISVDGQHGQGEEPHRLLISHLDS